MAIYEDIRVVLLDELLLDQTEAMHFLWGWLGVSLHISNIFTRALNV